MCRGEFWFEGQGPFEMFRGCLVSCAVDAAVRVKPLQVFVVCVDAHTPPCAPNGGVAGPTPGRRSSLCCLAEPLFQRLSDRVRDLILYREDVGQLTVEAIAPEV